MQVQKSLLFMQEKLYLKKLSPKENLNIPPLKYILFINLKNYFNNDEIIINGGIKTIEEIKNHLSKS